MDNRSVIGNTAPTESKMLHLISGLRNCHSYSAEKLSGVSSPACNLIAKVGNQINYRAFQGHVWESRVLSLKPSKKTAHEGKMNSMQFSRWQVCAAFLWSCTFALGLPAQAKHLKKSDLPAAVQKVADQQSQGATVRGYASETEDGKLQYEVSLTVDGHTKVVAIAPDGTINEIEEQVFLDKLPSPVRDALQKKAAPGRIVKVESLTKRDQLVAYEAQIITGGKKSEIQVAPDGGALTHPE